MNFRKAYEDWLEAREVAVQATDALLHIKLPKKVDNAAMEAAYGPADAIEQEIEHADVTTGEGLAVQVLTLITDGFCDDGLNETLRQSARRVLAASEAREHRQARGR